MGKMGYIHYLCETDNRKELIEEVGSTEIADQFLFAHKQIRLRKDEAAFDKLNEIVDDTIEEVKDDVKKAKEESKGIDKELNLLFKDIERMN
tara:strand:- start:344 stop:619 length:276 start_codon:yes stop_codon:yes gene_type:complete